MSIIWISAVALTAPMLFAPIAPVAGRTPQSLLADRSTLCGASVDSVQKPASALDDPTIVAIFDAANTADIETGSVAVKRGQTKAVRDFGAMLARDHKVVRQQGRDLAKKLGVTPTPPVGDQSAKAHAAAMKSLRTASTANFDKTFLEYEISYHKAVLDAIHSTLLPAIKNAELKALVVKVGPAFEAHMLAAQQLLNGKSTAMGH